MLGVSLSYRALVAETGLGCEQFIKKLYEKGVRSIELRAVTAEQDPQDVLNVADRLWRCGMQISVHTAPRTAETAAVDIFKPLTKVLGSGRQEKVTLVLHPVNGNDLYYDNIRMLDTLSNAVRTEYPCAKLALENNRLMPDKSNGDSADFVMRVIQNTDPEYAGLCLDFGHFAWASRVWETESPIIPPKQFTERIIHTHIHSLYPTEKGHTTHFPLQSGTLPLAEYISSFRDAYNGVYNLELEPERFVHLMDGYEGILGSIDVLKKYTV